MGAQSHSDEVAISVRQLRRDFGSTRAVDDLNFDVGRGELFGLVGPDGAGKTTTLRLLAGILPPTAGSATVAGFDVLENPELARDSLAYMPQRFGLYEDLTVAENLAFYADLYQVPKSTRPERLDRLFHFSGLRPFSDRLAGNLSGGMKQKLGLSCALIHSPAILLLDEPTFGVDPVSRRDLWLILHEMIAEGVTIVVSTSYLDEAERCDRVALLNEGMVIALDKPQSIQGSLPGTGFAIESPLPRQTRDRLRTLDSVHSAVLFGERVHVHAAPGVSEANLRQALTGETGGMTEISHLEPTLEDAFIWLVSENDAAEAGLESQERAE